MTSATKKERISIDAMDSLWHISDTKKGMFSYSRGTNVFSLFPYLNMLRMNNDVQQLMNVCDTKNCHIRISITAKVFINRKVGYHRYYYCSYECFNDVFKCDTISIMILINYIQYIWIWLIQFFNEKVLKNVFLIVILMHI